MYLYSIWSPGENAWVIPPGDIKYVESWMTTIRQGPISPRFEGAYIREYRGLEEDA